MQVTAMITRIRTANPANPKTNPESGLFLRKAFPSIWDASLEVAAVVEAVATSVNCPLGVGAKGATEGLFRFQHLGRKYRRFQRTWL